MTAGAVATRADIDLRPPDAEPTAKQAAKTRLLISLLAVFDGKRWVALCREFGVVSEGDSAFEAIISARNAVAEAVAVAEQRGISAGSPVPDKELRAFLAQHVGPEPVSGLIFAIA